MAPLSDPRESGAVEHGPRPRVPRAAGGKHWRQRALHSRASASVLSRAVSAIRGGEYPVAEEAYEQLISLPMFHGMTDQDADDVVNAVCKVMAAYRR